MTSGVVALPIGTSCFFFILGFSCAAIFIKRHDEKEKAKDKL